MKKYAIVIKGSNEFYPDPIYTDIDKAKNKIQYLENYRIENNMSSREYILEELTSERETQHEEEWKRFCEAID